ncbi:MAG: LLM class flavin-dependent oxidoreductase [Gemmatimonadales bacterium]
MSDGSSGGSLRIFATCPPSYSVTPITYRRQVMEVAQWCESAAGAGLLIYTDNGLVDPWALAHEVLACTHILTPLVAVQPVYMHPYTVAKMVSTLGFLFGRRVHLNMVAGGFRNDLEALDDRTPHDERYDRLIEYTTIINQLLRSDGPLTFEGRYYRVTNLSLKPSLSPALLPEVFVSGSSDAGLAAARTLNALAVRYPKRAAEYEAEPVFGPGPTGIRLGIIARADPAEAWRVARARFPDDRKGQLTHQLAMKTSDSEWHRQLSESGDRETDERDPYWTLPFENYKTFCPYLVGSYDRVADELARYVGAGCGTVIVDVPPDQTELIHTGIVCRRAVERVAR